MFQVFFSTDGIRGIVGRWPFDEQGPVIIGRALGQYVGAFNPHPIAVVGRDTRASGQGIAEGLMSGLQGAGVHVIYLDVITTPGVAYLARKQQADLGISVSASHSPPPYNGIKLVDRYGLRLQREDEMAIEALVESLAEIEASPSRWLERWANGSHLWELYIQDHAPQVRSAALAGFQVVLDCAHGAASVIAPEVFRRRGARVVAVNTEPNGYNINLQAGSEYVRRHPDDLIRAVEACGASYGFAFDGDGDRLVVVDAQGNLYTGDDLLFALAVLLHAQGRLRHDTVVTTHTTNRGLDAALARLGIRVIRTGRGDKAVEAAMWSGGYTLGGEQVGNLIINDGCHTAADAVYVATELADLLHTMRTSLAALTVPYRKWPQVLVAMQLIAEPPPDIGFWLDRHLESRAQQLRACLGTDCRALAWLSSTEPELVRMLVEGGAAATLESVLAETDSLCRSLREAVCCIGPRVNLLVLS